MNTPKPKNPLPGIRTLAKDMARQGQAKVSSDSAKPKSNKPVPVSAFVDDGEKNVYQAPSETKPVSREKIDPNIPDLAVKEKNKPSEKLKGVKFASALKTTSGEILKPIKSVTAPTKPATEPAIVVDNEEAATATIIRDTKHNRFRLFPAISTSLKQWFLEIKEKYFTKKAPKYTVPETSRRKGVIQEATSKTGKLTTFDRTSLQERIRQRQERTVPKEPTTTWSANTEPGFLLLEEPDEEIEEEPKVSNVKIETRKSFRTPPPPKPVETIPVPPPTPIVPPPVAIIEPPKPIEPIIVPPPTPTVEVPSPVTVTQTTPPTLNERPVTPQPKPVEAVLVPPPTPIVPPPVETTSNLPLVRTLASEETASREDQARQTQLEVKSDTKRRPVGLTRLQPKNLRDWLFSLNTNLISLGVIGLLVVLSITSLVGYFWFYESNQLTLTTAPSYPSILSVPLQAVFVSDLTKENLFKQIIENQKQSKYETLQIALISSPTGEKLLPATSLINTIGDNINSVFAHSIKTIYFGNANRISPFLVMKITDQDTARGGLLTWEENMADDLKPLFVAFKPDLATSTAGLSFSDIVIAGNDARILKASDGTELLIYALTKENILIITSDQKTLIELITLISKQI